MVSLCNACTGLRKRLHGSPAARRPTQFSARNGQFSAARRARNGQFSAARRARNGQFSAARRARNGQFSARPTKYQDKYQERRNFRLGHGQFSARPTKYQDKYQERRNFRLGRLSTRISTRSAAIFGSAD